MGALSGDYGILYPILAIAIYACHQAAYNQSSLNIMLFIAYLHTCCMHYTQGSQSAAAKFSVKNVTKLLRFVNYHDP